MEEKLEYLKNLVMKYMPPVCGQQDIYRALTCIFSLQEDLSRHILVEDGILVPIVNRRMHADLESRFDTPGEKGEELSSREKEILVCVAKGMLNKEIADAENISICSATRPAWTMSMPPKCTCGPVSPGMSISIGDLSRKPASSPNIRSSPST